MAKRILKCYYCSQQFNANEEEFVKVNGNRYAHKKCCEEAMGKMSKEDKDKKILEDYIKELFKINSLTPKIKKQIERYIKECNYSYSGIYKTLKYFYEIKGNSIDKANGGIGIVEWVYNQAFDYWRGLWEAQQQNIDIKIEKFVLPVKEIHIPPPQREPMKHMRKLFSFLEEEV